MVVMSNHTEPTDADTPNPEPEATESAPEIDDTAPPGGQAVIAAPDSADAVEAESELPRMRRFTPAEQGMIRAHLDSKEPDRNKRLNDAQFDLLIYQAERTGLDPAAGQIWAWVQDGAAVIMASIHGLRLVADRTGELVGRSAVEYMNSDGEWVEAWAGPRATGHRPSQSFGSDMPYAARIWLRHSRYDDAVPFIATWDEYGRNTRMWRDKGAFMLGKVAEALGLRALFPNDLSGIYTDDEIDTATAVATASKGSDDQPGADDPLARAATDLFAALPDDARVKVGRYWSQTYVPKVLGSTLAQAKSITNGALFRFEPGSPHVVAMAEMLIRAAGSTGTAVLPSLGDLVAAAKESTEPATDDGDGAGPAPDTATPAPPPPVDDDPLTDAQRYIIDAARDQADPWSVSGIAAAIGITEAAPVRSTVGDLENLGLIVAAGTDDGGARLFKIDAEAVEAYTSNGESPDDE